MGLMRGNKIFRRYLTRLMMFNRESGAEKKAWQNTPVVHINVGSTRYYLGPDRAVDGLKRDLSWNGGHYIASKHSQSTVEWRVDLGEIFRFITFLYNM